MYEDLVKRLNGAAGGPEGIRMCLEAAAAITNLLGENQSLRNNANALMAWAEKVEKKQKLTEATNRQIIENYLPVIRCENCDMWNTLDSAGRKSLGNYVCSCAFWTKEDGPVAYTRPNDFCSYGVRRDNDD